MRTYASTPGRFRLNFWLWARCFPGRLAFMLLPPLVLLTSGARTGNPLVLWLMVLVPLPRLAAEIGVLRRKCAEGNVNPAVVVSLRPCLIAVSANMGKRPGDAWPVIKILHQPLGRAPGPRLQVGDRLPAVALYQNGGSAAALSWGGLVPSAGRHWGDFSPTAVACLTDDGDAVREAMRRLEVNEFGPDHWARLSENLARVPQPYKPGLYWMRQG